MLSELEVLVPHLISIKVGTGHQVAAHLLVCGTKTPKNTTLKIKVIKILAASTTTRS